MGEEKGGLSQRGYESLSKQEQVSGGTGMWMCGVIQQGLETQQIDKSAQSGVLVYIGKSNPVV